MIRIRLRLPWRKRHASQDLKDAREIKDQQQVAATDARKRRARAEREVSAPLRRTREQMRRENHVYEEIVALIRRNSDPSPAP